MNKGLGLGILSLATVALGLYAASMVSLLAAFFLSWFALCLYVEVRPAPPRPLAPVPNEALIERQAA